MQNRLSFGILVAGLLLMGAATALALSRPGVVTQSPAPIVLMLSRSGSSTFRFHGWTLTLPLDRGDTNCSRDGYDSCSDNSADGEAPDGDDSDSATQVNSI